MICRNRRVPAEFSPAAVRAELVYGWFRPNQPHLEAITQWASFRLTSQVS